MSSGYNPPTGTQTAPEALVKEAISLFFPEPEKLVLAGTTGGVNNVSQFVTTPEGEKFVLRIYNNGNNTRRVAFEHAILEELEKLPRSFHVPRAKKSITGQKAFERLSNGAEACVFYIIPGTLASTTTPKEVGRAAGELTVALGSLNVPTSMCPTPPYYDLWAVHHAVSREKFYEALKRDDWFAEVREPLMDLVRRIELLEAHIQSTYLGKLPVQLIHGDLHYDNVLVVEDTVTGLLDFEFCAFDWRAMELAICLSKYLSEADPLVLSRSFIEGYMKPLGALTDAEMEAIPDLIRLRVLSNVVYFTGRAIAGEDSIVALTSRVKSYLKRLQWLDVHGADLVHEIRRQSKV